MRQTGQPPAGELRSYGRRHGRKLSPRQARLAAEVLPRLLVELGQPAPAQLTNLFADRVEDVWLEIGFGGGEHLLWQAERNRAVGIIGCEPFLDGVVKVVAGVQAAQLGNIRLYSDDARQLLRWLPEGALARAFILFPDPWPKTRHRKRRLVTAALLRELARVLRPGSELRIATDVGDYARAVLVAMREVPEFAWLAEAPADWRGRPPDWPATRYEQKAVAAGRRCIFLRFARRDIGGNG